MSKNMIIAAVTCAALALPAAAQVTVQLTPTVDVTLRSDNPDKSYSNLGTMELYTVRQTAYNFSHPTAMYSASDFARVKSALSAGTAPTEVQDAYAALKANKYAKLTYTANPQEKIVRGDVTGTGLEKENYMYAMRDAAAAYQMALLWQLGAGDDYANKAVEILNAWAATCKSIESNDANKMLAAGAQGYTFACAAEMLVGYSGWASAEQTAFKQWMVDVFASKNRDFLDNHQGTNNCDLHYWSNWDLVNLSSYMAIGILTEDGDMVDYVVDYFYNGKGNGAIGNLVGATHDDPLGSGEKIAQNQESGRDQGHAQMSAMVAANLAQMAYTLYQNNKLFRPKLDFFAANDGALLKMAEYVALGNLRSGSDSNNADGSWLVEAEDMPFADYHYCDDCVCRDKNHGAHHTQMADDSGRGKVRPGWEIYLNHYKNVKGLTSGFKYVELMASKLRPELGPGDTDRYGDNSGAFDQLGWGTLMLYK